MVELFHPSINAWFQCVFGTATDVQQRSWPAILAGRNVLISAPTGSGKTLAAFMGSIDKLIRQGIQESLPDQTLVLYVSPLKALSNDIRRNLEIPLTGIREELRKLDFPDVDVHSLVRTGDTSEAERRHMRRFPPHILITTPESLYVLLGSESGRRTLSTVQTVIIDEVHAVVSNKRGAHLSLSLERLQALTKIPLQRIGLSATQNPIREVAKFLVGASRSDQDCVLVDSGQHRQRDLQIVVPPSPLEAVMSGDVWQQLYDQLANLVLSHRTTLIFVNTRRHAERIARHLSDRIGDEHVTAHHGSLSKERRFDAEQRLKDGRLKALVATASLELGIDIGDVNLVCQIGSCRSISTFLQRTGRASHSIHGVPKARMFPLSLDELVECVSLFDGIKRGELDLLTVPEKPLDVLAQQIIAETAASEWAEDDLFLTMSAAYPYRTLSRLEFDEIIRSLAEGYGARRGKSRQHLHHDAVQQRLRGRRGARLVALTSGGTIPDNADYNVVLEPEGIVVGTVNEDFAVESLAGDIFQLGNTSYRIRRVEAGLVRVEDARGRPPTIPFWLGEAPSRSDELSKAVSRLRSTIESYTNAEDVVSWMTVEIGIDRSAAAQLAEYLMSAKSTLGILPTQETIILERFFDETEGMHLIIHSPFGSRLNRAWGLALRKRFCRKFNFELQAAATEDSIIFSLNTSHSFPLDEIASYLHSNSVRKLLVQALLDAPMFNARWRWNSSIALAIPRFRGGKKVPPQLQRIYAEDLLADVFPDQIACGENIVGDREIPHHFIVAQTINDCLQEAMDINGLECLLKRVEQGDVRVIAKDVTEPSPLALQILSARPYAFLDDVPLEERRTQAVMSRRWSSTQSAADLGRLDPAAIERVRGEAFPDAETPDELHDVLMWCGFMTEYEVNNRSNWIRHLETLTKAKRAVSVETANGVIWIAVERLPRFVAVFPAMFIPKDVVVPEPYISESFTFDAALVEILRGRLEVLGPTSAAIIAGSLGFSPSVAETALIRLEQEGFVLRMSPSSGMNEAEWCERGLLARIHHYTINRLRKEIEPVTSQEFMRFLFQWQHVLPSERQDGPDALQRILLALEGFEAPASAWEKEILRSRMNHYEAAWLDDLCLSGRVGWARLSKAKVTDSSTRRTGPIRTTPIALLGRRNMPIWNAAAMKGKDISPHRSSRAVRVQTFLEQRGASFFDEIVDGTDLIPSETEDALSELVASGMIVSDSFAGIRALLIPMDRRKPFSGTKSGTRTSAFGIQDAGRWSLIRSQPLKEDLITQHVAQVLLARYGVIFWRLLEREATWLPPWRDILRVLRRLEARGEIRGGHFVAGVSGEQYALPEALAALRNVRRQSPCYALIRISGADPLNLVGILTPGLRVPALTGNHILYRDGIPIGTKIGGKVTWSQDLDPEIEHEAQSAIAVNSNGMRGRYARYGFPGSGGS